MECIILAGGLGTRLRSVIGDQPKCMAEVNGKPFLHYMFDYLEEQGCTRLILSLGYGHESVTRWLDSTPRRTFGISHVIEQEPLCTGGGIRLAMQETTDENVIVLNGDTMFRISLPGLLDTHLAASAETTLALKPMRSFDRYGAVRTGEENIITAFEEKKYRDQGLINGGIYCITRSDFMSRELPVKFSFEKDYLEAEVAKGIFAGYTSDAYFIDIGIPGDYEKAQKEL